LGTKLLIYCVLEEEESTSHLVEECHRPPVVLWEVRFIRKENNGREIEKIKRSMRFRWSHFSSIPS